MPAKILPFAVSMVSDSRAKLFDFSDEIFPAHLIEIVVHEALQRILFMGLNQIFRLERRLNMKSNGATPGVGA